MNGNVHTPPCQDSGPWAHRVFRAGVGHNEQGVLTTINNNYEFWSRPAIVLVAEAPEAWRSHARSAGIGYHEPWEHGARRSGARNASCGSLPIWSSAGASRKGWTSRTSIRAAIGTPSRA